MIDQATSRNLSSLDRIYSKEKFTEKFGKVLGQEAELSDNDIDILLIYLSRDINAIAYDGKVTLVGHSLSIKSANAVHTDYQVLHWW